MTRTEASREARAKHSCPGSTKTCAHSTPPRPRRFAGRRCGGGETDWYVGSPARQVLRWVRRAAYAQGAAARCGGDSREDM